MIFMTRDEEHLNLLSVFNYIFGGLGIFGSLFPLIYVGLGIFFVLGGSELLDTPMDPEMAFMGWFFIAFGFVFFVILLGAAVCGLLSGRFISKRANYMYSFILACIQCAFSPLGTILGVFTIIVLSRETVKTEYENRKKIPLNNVPPGN
jgi:MFS family permease